MYCTVTQYHTNTHISGINYTTMLCSSHTVTWYLPTSPSLSPVVSLGTPTQLTVVEITPTSFTLSWMPPLGDFWDESTLFYLLNVTDMEEDDVVPNQHTVNGTTLQLRVGELLSGHVHQVSVAAVSGENVGPSELVFVKTSPKSAYMYSTCIMRVGHFTLCNPFHR